jgi:hypothetical protein
MKQVKKTTITVETERVFILGERLCRVWCEGCQHEVGMVRLDAAVTLSGTSLSSIYRQIEEQKLHVKEEADGGLLICTKTLMQ